VTVTIVLADDHPIVLDGLEALFAYGGEFAVVATCRDGEAALSAVRRHRPDILILDVGMPGKDGIGVLRDMVSEDLPTRVVLLTASLSDHQLLEAMRLGVSGVVLKDMAPDLLLQCVRKVHAGEKWLERHSTGRALETLLRREATARHLAETLTLRELEIARMVTHGLRNKEIANKLALTEGTVKIHLHNVYQKLGVDSRVALTIFARDGLL
jgi:DNA-binding NarL/FixJ family response regulator